MVLKNIFLCEVNKSKHKTLQRRQDLNHWRNAIYTLYNPSGQIKKLYRSDIVFSTGCEDRIWTCDLRVMSPASFRAALPRVIFWLYINYIHFVKRKFVIFHKSMKKSAKKQKRQIKSAFTTILRQQTAMPKDKRRCLRVFGLCSVSIWCNLQKLRTPNRTLCFLLIENK